MLEKKAGLVAKETSRNLKKFTSYNTSDFTRGSGFQPRLCNYGYSVTFFRGWKPLPRVIDANLMTLIPDFMKFHMSAAAGLTHDT